MDKRTTKQIVRLLRNALNTNTQNFLQVHFGNQTNGKLIFEMGHSSFD